MLASTCRTAKERNFFLVALVISSFVWVALIVTLVGLIYAPFVALGVVVGHAFFLARLTGNAVRVGSRQLPDLYKRVENATAKLGLDRIPEVYVVSGNGVLNAFATKLFSRRFIILNAEILDACEALDEGKQPGDPSAVDFIIGHELGHLALGHLSWNWLLWPAKLFPLIGPAYSRACEYSADACGLAASDDVDTSSRALTVLAAGGKQARKVSLEGLLEQRHDTAGFIMALVELNSTHPYLSKRVAALHRVRDPGTAPDVGRNPLSYVMAPFFAFAGGGVAGLATIYVYVCIIGILAAIAIPNFQKFQERSKAAQLGALDDPFASPSTTNPFASAALDAPATTNPFMPAQNDAQALGTLTGGPLGGLGGAQIDDDDDDAPAPPPPARLEAKSWLKGQFVAKNPEAVANVKTLTAIALVDKLYKAGAPKVFVSDIDVDDKGEYANDIIVEMPSRPALRKKLVDICTAEFKKQGFDEPCADEGAELTSELFFNFE